MLRGHTIALMLDFGCAGATGRAASLSLELTVKIPANVEAGQGNDNKNDNCFHLYPIKNPVAEPI